MGWKGQKSIDESRERIVQLDRKRRVVDRKQGRTIPKLENMDIGEAREFTLATLHIDIQGFKEKTRDLTMTQNSRFLSIFLTEMTRIVTEFDGEVEKYVGDHVTALFGVGYDQQRAAMNSINCGLTMLTIIKYVMGPYLSNINLPTFGCRVGIDSGSIWLERMGIRGANEFILVGNSVSIASQLEELAGENEILLGHNIYQNLSEEEKKHCHIKEPDDSWNWQYSSGKKYPYYRYSGNWKDYPIK